MWACPVLKAKYRLASARTHTHTLRKLVETDQTANMNADLTCAKKKKKKYQRFKKSVRTCRTYGKPGVPHTGLLPYAWLFLFLLVYS